MWSLGVVLYTLLIGKPPFETADVRSTYRRIRSNAYFFPEGVPISEEAADLIRRVLRTEPELRPSLDGMLKHPFFTRFDAPEKAAISVAYQPKRVPAEADGRGQDGVVQIDVWAGGEAASRVKYSPDLRLPASLHIPPPLSPNPSSGWPTREQQVAVLPTQQSAGSAASLRLQRSNSGLGDSNIDTLSHCPLSPSTFSSVSSAFASNAVSRTASSSLAGGLLSRTASIAVADRSSSGSRNRLLNISPGGTPTSRQQLASKDCGFVVSRSTSGGSAPDGAAASGSSAPVSPGTWTPQDAAAKLAEWDQQRALEAREQAERMRDWNQKAGQAKTTQDLESVAKQLQRQQSALQSYRDRFEYGSAVKGLDSPRVASACKGEPGAESHTITVSVRCDAALLVPLADQVTGSAEAANSPGPRAVLGTFPAGRPPRGGSLPRDNKGLFGEEASFEVLKPDAGLGPFSSGTANSSADDSRKLASAASSAKTGSTLLVQKPSVWVAKWVDYSSKYGMGYVLSNGAVGVLFNDGTKVALSLPQCAIYVPNRTALRLSAVAVSFLSRSVVWNARPPCRSCSSPTDPSTYTWRSRGPARGRQGAVHAKSALCC